MDDNSSDPEGYLVATPESPSQASRPYDDSRVVTVLSQAHDGKFFFCDREDGAITIPHIKTGEEVLQLKVHSVEVRHLDFNPQKGRLLSVDTSRRCIVTQLTPPSAKTDSWSQAEIILDHRAQSAITQALLSPDGSAILISTLSGQGIWDETSGQFCNYPAGDGRWLVHLADDTVLCWQGAGRLNSIDGLARRKCRSTLHITQTIV